MDALLRKKLERALQAGAERDYPSAVRNLEGILSSTDEVPEALLYLGRARHALGDHAKAISCFNEYLRIKPRSFAGHFFAGRSYLALGIPKKAVLLLNEAIKHRPEDAEALALLGIAYLKARRSASAVEILERAVHVVPNDQRIYRAYINALLIRGVKLARSGDPVIARQMLGFVVGNGLDEVLPRLELGRLYREAGDMEAALFQYQKAIALAPNDFQLRWYRASVLMALGKSAEAHADLDVLRSSGEDIPKISWNAELVDRFMLRSFIEQGDWKRALLACREWLKVRGSDASVHAIFAEAHRQLGNLDSAENHARKALELSPKESALHYCLIPILWEKNDWSQLADELRAAKSAGCDSEILLRFQALLTTKTEKDDKKALLIVQEAIRRTGPAPALMLALAQTYVRLDLDDLALPWFDKTIALEPNNETALLGRIEVLELMENASESSSGKKLLEAYRLYFTKHPEASETGRKYALLLVKRNLFKEAAHELELLLVRETENRSLRRVLAYTYRKSGRYSEAVVLLKNLLKEDTRDTRLLLELAHCLDKSGSSSYAIALLKKSLIALPGSGEPALALGILLARVKRNEEALDAFREAAARSPKDPRPLRKMSDLYRASGVSEFADRYEREAKLRERT